MARAKATDTQLTIRVKAAQYRKLRAAAKKEKVTITAYARGAIMDRVYGVTGEAPGVDMLPAWLLHVLLFFAQRGPVKSRA